MSLSNWGEPRKRRKSLLNRLKGSNPARIGTRIIIFQRYYAFQGNKKQALPYLAEYAKKGFRDGNHDFILIDPFFESLRDDPEFKAIVKQA